MTNQITRNQRAVYEYLRRFFAENDQLPPCHVIAEYFGWASANAAQNYLAALERKGFIERNAVGKYRFARNRCEAAA